MSVMDRDALAESPLADLHAIASEIGIDGFRRLRRDALIDAIVDRQGGGEAGDEPAAKPARARPPRRRAPKAEKTEMDFDDDEPETGDDDEDEADAKPPASRRAPRGGRRAAQPRAPREPRAASGPEPERNVEGVIELLDNGSAFVRVAPGETGDDDAYVSAAQVRRCELVDGDRISGPVRAPRRSERHPSVIRIETINGEPAEEVAAGTRFDDLPASFPTDRLDLGDGDPTLKAISWLTPIGKGSRVVITGPPRAGKTEALRRIAAALSGRNGLEVSVVLAGARPEELHEWSSGPVAVAAGVSFAASPDAQAQAVERTVESAKRLAARGGDAVVLIDSLEHLPSHAARRALAAARNIVDGGSLTVIATAAHPLGGETTHITLDAALAAAGRFPALDLAASGTLRAELLVGEAGATAIAQARAEAVG